MRPEHAGHGIFFQLENGGGGAKLFHRAEDGGNALTFGLGELEFIEEPGEGLVAPGGGSAAGFELFAIKGTDESPRGADFDAVGKDREGDGVVEFVVTVDDGVDDRLLESPGGVAGFIGCGAFLFHH